MKKTKKRKKRHKQKMWFNPHQEASILRALRAPGAKSGKAFVKKLKQGYGFGGIPESEFGRWAKEIEHQFPEGK
jgi:hypothetical protein